MKGEEIMKISFVKSPDGEQMNAVDMNGKIIGQIVKQRFGTHGHWKGWTHYCLHEASGKLLYAGVPEHVVIPDGRFEPWTDAPCYFANVKEFKNYYNGLQ